MNYPMTTSAREALLESIAESLALAFDYQRRRSTLWAALTWRPSDWTRDRTALDDHLRIHSGSGPGLTLWRLDVAEDLILDTGEFRFHLTSNRTGTRIVSTDHVRSIDFGLIDRLRQANDLSNGHFAALVGQDEPRLSWLFMAQTYVA